MRGKALLLAAVGEAIVSGGWTEPFTYSDGALPTTGTYVADSGAIGGSSVWLAYNDGTVYSVPNIATNQAVDDATNTDNRAARGIGTGDTFKLTFTPSATTAARFSGCGFYLHTIGLAQLVVNNGNLICGLTGYSAAFTGPTAALEITASTGNVNVYDNGVLVSNLVGGAVTIEAALILLRGGSGHATLDDVTLTVT